MLARRAEQGALEVMPHQKPAGVQQLVEELEQAALGGLGFPAFRLDALANVPVEEVDGLPRHAVGGVGVLAGELDERAEWHAGDDQLHPGGDGVQVVGGVQRHLARFDRHEQSGLLEVLEQRHGHAAALGQLVEGEGLRRAWPRNCRDERLVRGLELALEKAPDDGEGEATTLEVPDARQPFEVALGVPGHAALAAWGLEQALALVEADRVDGHPGRPGQLFDPILHEYLL